MEPRSRFDRNQKIVYYCLQKIHCPAAWHEDCLQEGMLELWRVCHTFNESAGFAFSTYAVPAVWGAMKRFCREKISVIRLPRTMLKDECWRELIVGSLDTPINEDTENTMADFIPDKPDFYEGLFEDQLDDFLATIKGRYHDVAEEWVYSYLYGQEVTQIELAKKYQCSQPQVARYIKRFKDEYRTWISRIDWR